ncbi:hypothetical protein Tco_0238660 [Tanacetum coccineum]
MAERTIEELLHAPTEGITSTLRFRNVPNDVIKLMMFPYSLEGAAKTCEAWEGFKELLRACPHYEFMELTQVDTFYNGLNENEQDSLNTAAGGNLLSKTTREALNIIENKSKVCYSRNRSNASRMNATSSKTDERIDTFAPTIKSLLMNKEKLLELAKIPLNENCSVMLLKKLPEKLGDPDKFLIPCNSREWIFAPTIKSLLMNKEKLLELAKIPLNENCSVMLLKKLPEKLGDPDKFLIPSDPRVPLILGRSFLRTGRALIDVYGEEITLRVDNEAVTFNLDQTTRYSSTNDKSVNRIDIIDVVCEEYALEFLGFSNSSGGNPTPTSEPFTSGFILEEIKAYLKDDSISPEIDHADCNPEEDILTKAKSSIEEPPELELKDLPSHLEYAFLEENDKLLVIIAKDLKNDEKEALLKVLKSHKRAIA